MSMIGRFLLGILASVLVVSQCNAQPRVAGQSSRPETLSPATPTTMPMRVYYGKVTREAGGAALAGATVELVEHRIGEVTISVLAFTKTSSQGSYELSTTSPAQVVMLRVSAKGCARLRTVVGTFEQGGLSFAPALHRMHQDVSLRDDVKLRGKVLDENNQPLANVRLRAREPELGKQATFAAGSTVKEDLHTVSGPDGSFAFEGAAGGKYTLLVESSRHVPLTREINAPDGNIIVRLSRQGSVIEGNVFKLNSGEGVAGAAVELYSPSLSPDSGEVLFDAFKTVSGRDGAFRFERLPAGSYRIRSQAGELGTFLPGASHILLGEKQTTSGVKVCLYGGHTITGKVVEHLSDQPLSGVKVLVAAREKNTLQGETDDQGQFRIEKVFYPHFGLVVQKKGYWAGGDGYFPVSLPADTLEVEVKPDFRMSRTAQVSGLVRMEAAAKPRQTTSGGQVALQASHFISGKVTDRSDKTLVGIMVQAFSTNGVIRGAKSDAQGRYRIEELPTGYYIVVASNQSATERKDDVPTDSEHVDFVLGGAKSASPK